jgi:hypothetical protein
LSRGHTTTGPVSESRKTTVRASDVVVQKPGKWPSAVRTGERADPRARGSCPWRGRTPSTSTIGTRTSSSRRRAIASSRKRWDCRPSFERPACCRGAATDDIVEALAVDVEAVLVDLACGRGGYGFEVARRRGPVSSASTSPPSPSRGRRLTNTLATLSPGTSSASEISKPPASTMRRSKRSCALTRSSSPTRPSQHWSNADAF